MAAVARGASARLRLYLGQSALPRVVYALVTSRLLVASKPLKMDWKLPSVQDAVARGVPGAGHFDSIGPLLQQLLWLPVHSGPNSRYWFQPVSPSWASGGRMSSA